jgi:double-stranded uracil-DNA glycosylase
VPNSYLVPDLLAPGLNLVFCGTAPSKASAAARAYYAKPGNRFWPTLSRVGMTPRRLAPAEYPELLALGIGLTDLCKIHCGTDADLPRGAFDVAVLDAKLRRYRPGWVAFTSKNAGSAFLGRKVDYGVQTERVGSTRLFVLPSPSGLATRFWDEEWWRELARTYLSIREARPGKAHGQRGAPPLS